MVSVVGRAGAAAIRSFETRKPDFLRRRLFASAPRCSSLQPPDVPLLADAARISLSAKEAEDFAPKIRQVIDCLLREFLEGCGRPGYFFLAKPWITQDTRFGQLQAVDLDSVQPSFRADTELNADLREDSPETFQNREAMLAEVPTYDSPYIKVPKVINKE